MHKLTISGLLLCGALSTGASANGVTIEHATRVDHRSGPVEANYRGDVVVRHKQIGTVAPPGAQATLTCVWAADVSVVREAKSAGGVVLSRNFVSKDVASGRRAGWCNTHRAAIAKDVAARVGNAEAIKQQLAREDLDRLHAELERHQGAGRTS
jgi:hypothetical protein